MSKYLDEIQQDVWRIQSPYDKRDFILPLPKGDIPKSFSWRKPLPILDQGRSDYCTAFALMNAVFSGANAGMRFKKHYTNEFAKAFAEEQFRNSASTWSRLFLSRDVWATRGAHPRAALKMLHKGFTHNGLTVKCGPYYRVPISSAQDYKRYIYNYGPLYVGVFYNRNDLMRNTWADFGSRPKRLGHQFVIDSYDELDLQLINSWGESWGDDGTGYMTNDNMHLAREVWCVPSNSIDFHEK